MNEQLELALGRFGTLGPITTDERFFVPEKSQSVRVRDMTANDLISAAHFAWAQDTGVIGQALADLWDTTSLDVPRGGHATTKVASLAPWYFERPRYANE